MLYFVAIFGEKSAEILRLDDVVVDLNGRRAFCSEQELDLTAAEFDVLKALISAAGSPVSRDTLSREALGRSTSPMDRSLDNHVSRLRRKMGAASDGRPRIVSIRGVGYLYRVSGQPVPLSDGMAEEEHLLPTE